jgi:hypothetical protein
LSRCFDPESARRVVDFLFRSESVRNKRTLGQRMLGIRGNDQRSGFQLDSQAQSPATPGLEDFLTPLYDTRLVT